MNYVNCGHTNQMKVRSTAMITPLCHRNHVFQNARRILTIKLGKRAPALLSTEHDHIFAFLFHWSRGKTRAVFGFTGSSAPKELHWGHIVDWSDGIKLEGSSDCVHGYKTELTSDISKGARTLNEMSRNRFVCLALLVMFFLAAYCLSETFASSQTGKKREFNMNSNKIDFIPDFIFDLQEQIWEGKGSGLFVKLNVIVLLKCTNAQTNEGPNFNESLEVWIKAFPSLAVEWWKECWQPKHNSYFSWWCCSLTLRVLLSQVYLLRISPFCSRWKGAPCIFPWVRVSFLPNAIFPWMFSSDEALMGDIKGQWLLLRLLSLLESRISFYGAPFVKKLFSTNF